MTAQEILDEIRLLGGRLEARDGRLRVEAPKGVLKPEHRQALTALKPELLALIRADREDTELQESKRRLEAAHISIAVFEDGEMPVIQSDTAAEQARADGGIIYTPADMYYHVQLQPDERRMLHDFRKRFGGLTE